MSVKQDFLASGYVVSTIWRDSLNLSIDNMIAETMKVVGVTPEELGFMADLSTPGDYETMVFRREDWDDPGVNGLPEVDFQRYNTEEEAIAGHEKLCEKWRDK